MIRFFGMRQAPGEDVTPAGGVRRRSRLAPLDEYGLPENPFAPPPDTQLPSARRRADVQQEPEPAPAPVMQTQAVRPAAQMEAPGAQREVPRARREVPQSQREVPQAPQAQMEVPQAPQAQRRRAYQPPQLEGPQFQAPVSPEIPDWLVAARQNNPPMNNRPQGPRVQAAPRSETYAQAGYPEELLARQREMEYQQQATPVRRRHGAQYAVRPTYEPQPVQRPAAQSASVMPPRPVMQPQPQRMEPAEDAVMSRAYHRPRREEPEAYRVEEDEETESTGFSIPWIPILAFAAALAAVIVWIMQVSYEKQTLEVLDARARVEAQIVQEHPLKYGDLISDKANKYNLHPAFVAAIILNESSFRPEATSNVDARGLMQLMDDTAGWIYEKMDDPTREYHFDDLYNPEINAEYGCWYLNYLSNLFYGDPVLVAAAFHAGQGEVRNWLNDSTYSRDGRSIRLEEMIDGPTKRYVTRVLDDFAAYKRLYFGG